MITTRNDEHLSSSPAKKKDDVFSRLDNRRDGVFSRLDNRDSLINTDGRHSNDSNEMTSSLETIQQQPITTIISKRRIKLMDVKDNTISSSPPPAHVTSIHQPPTNKVVCDNVQLFL